MRRSASKRSWFYGLKVQVVATSDGSPVEWYIYAGAESEQTGQCGLPLDLPAGSVLYTDAGYTDYVAEDIFHEASGNQQQTAPSPGANLAATILSQRHRNLL